MIFHEKVYPSISRHRRSFSNHWHCAAVERRNISGEFQQLETENLDFDVASLQAGLDFGISTAFSLGASVEMNTSDEFDDNIFTGTVRATYTPNPVSGIGLYYAVETVGDFETTMYGIEGGYAAPGFSVEAFYGAGDSDVFDLSVVGFEPLERDLLSTSGFDFEFGVGAGFSLGLGYRGYRVEDFLFDIENEEVVDGTVADLSFLARYTFAETASVFLKAGQITASNDDDRTDNMRLESVDETSYVSIGADFKLGRGALFESRSLSAYGF